DEHRPRLAAGGDAVGLVQGGDDVLVALDAERGLGDRLEQGVLVDVVQLVAVGAVAVDAAGNDQHGNAVQAGFADAAGGVGDAGGGNDDQGADAVAGAAHRIGHEGRAAFVGHQHGLDLVRGVEFVIQLGVV